MSSQTLKDSKVTNASKLSPAALQRAIKLVEQGYKYESTLGEPTVMTVLNEEGLLAPNQNHSVIVSYQVVQARPDLRRRAKNHSKSAKTKKSFKSSAKRGPRISVATSQVASLIAAMEKSHLSAETILNVVKKL